MARWASNDSLVAVVVAYCLGGVVAPTTSLTRAMPAETALTKQKLQWNVDGC